MPTERWAGDEHCGFCLQRYAVELEVHCAECDRPMCPLCVVHGRFDAALVCTDCRSEPDRAAGAL